ncbi:MAG TPA: (S)-ureidoglycine aminohydrolase [Bryobacteraceae bacterium]|nr:(S)-ureidoglycine aminohydrolase [Bryobacteraceae bacterium]
MYQLGSTRSSYQRDHLLLTPDTFVRAPLPGMRRANAIVHVSPAAGARFTQYTAEFEAGGSLGPASGQRFLYVLQGDIRVDGKLLGPDEYAYFPEGHRPVIEATDPARACVIEKPYIECEGVRLPSGFVGDERQVEAKPLGGDCDLQVRALIPDHPSFDFAVNTMTYQPGAALSMVEMHVMEHGLLMLAGGGIYRLGDHWYPVTAGDFIWMAPWCPQWFGALGKTPAKYLIYKDWNR